VCKPGGAGEDSDEDQQCGIPEDLVEFGGCGYRIDRFSEHKRRNDLKKVRSYDEKQPYYDCAPMGTKIGYNRLKRVTL
jgi:hypothetical protein